MIKGNFLEFNKLAALISDKNEPDKDMHFNFFPKKEKLEKVKGGPSAADDQTTVEFDLTAKGAATKAKLTGIFEPDEKGPEEDDGALDGDDMLDLMDNL